MATKKLKRTPRNRSPLKVNIQASQGRKYTSSALQDKLQIKEKHLEKGRRSKRLQSTPHPRDISAEPEDLDITGNVDNRPFTVIKATKNRNLSIVPSSTAGQTGPILSSTVNILPNLTDRFNFNVDHISERGVKRLVEDLNYAVDDVIFNILHQLDLKKKKIKPAVTFDRVFKEDLDPAYMGPLKPVFKLLRSGRFIEPEDRDTFLDNLLHNKICQSLDQAWFAGRTFYGSYDTSDPLPIDVLERMYDDIQKKNSWSSSQHWRSMTYSAVFSVQQKSKLGSKMDTITNDTLDSVKETIFAVYPTCCLKFRQIVHDVVDGFQQAVGRIVQQSQEISDTIQRDIVTSLMKVTTSNSIKFKFSPKYAIGTQNILPKRGESVLGTFQFGLSSSLENGNEVLMFPRVFTKSLLPLAKYT